MLYFMYIAYNWMCTSLRSSSFDKQGVMGFLFLWSLWVGCWGFTLGNHFVHVNIFLIGPPETLDVHSHGSYLQCLYSSGFCGCSYLTWPVSGLHPKSATQETRPLSCQEALPSFKYFSFYQRQRHLLNRNWPENGRTCCCACRVVHVKLLLLRCFRAKRGGGVLWCVWGSRGAAEHGPRRYSPSRVCGCPSTQKTSSDPGDQERQHMCPASLSPQQEGVGKKGGPCPRFGWIWRENVSIFK